MDGQEWLLAQAITGTDADGAGPLRGWAVLRRGGCPQRWICTTCPKNRTACRHVQGAPDADDPGVSADALAHERRAAKWLDPVTGDRKLTCLSRRSIPEDLTQHAFRLGAAASAQHVLFWLAVHILESGVSSSPHRV